MGVLFSTGLPVIEPVHLILLPLTLNLSLQQLSSCCLACMMSFLLQSDVQQHLEQHKTKRLSMIGYVLELL
jgi:hypothetical protein